jgi:hypothetical protein
LETVSLYKTGSDLSRQGFKNVCDPAETPNSYCDTSAIV